MSQTPFSICDIEMETRPKNSNRQQATMFLQKWPITAKAIRPF